MHKMTPPIKDLLPRLTPILKNRHEKVQENCIDLVGRIADRLVKSELTPYVSLHLIHFSFSVICPVFKLFEMIPVSGELSTCPPGSG